MYEKIRRWYMQCLYNDDILLNKKKKGVLTAEQAEEIIAQEA